MAVTPEFESNWLEMQDKYGAGIDSGDVDPIDDASQVDNTITIPVVKLVNPYVKDQDNEVQGYYYVPLKLFMDVVQADADAIESAWNTWFGEDSSHGVQGDWASLRVDVTTQTTAAQTAAGQAAAASNEWNNTYKPQVIQATTEASNVNAMLGSTGGVVTLTITNRDGTQTSKEVGFRIAMTCSSDEDMKTRAAGLEDGQFVMIASQVEPDNGKLYTRARNQQTVEPKGFSFIADLSGAQGIKGDTPVITADSDGTIYSDGVKVTEVVKNVVSSTNTWLTNTQSTWNNWFSDTLSTGVRKVWSTWYASTQTAWNNFWPAAKNTWESWFGTSSANGVQKEWADLKADAISATNGAENVNATISGTTLTVTNRAGTSTSVNTKGEKGDQGIQGIQGIQGEKGDKGDTGDAAGFGTPTATVDANVGTPSVIVTASGSDTAKVFAFAFHNLKGEKGDDLDWSTISDPEKQQLITEMLTYLEAHGFDTAPTSGSTKPVTSNGIYVALQGKQDTITFATIPTAEAVIDELV